MGRNMEMGEIKCPLIFNVAYYIYERTEKSLKERENK